MSDNKDKSNTGDLLSCLLSCLLFLDCFMAIAKSR